LNINNSLERIFTPLQQDLEKVGIKLNLVFVTPQAGFEKLMKRKYKMHYVSWTGLFFPNPETSMHSKYADKPETNNVTGINIPRIDTLCEQYDKSYDVDERIKILQEIDKLAVEGHYYAFGWVAPYSLRTTYWNKFDMPEWGLSYTGDFASVLSLWWSDPAKVSQLEKAKADEALSMPIGTEKIDYWKTSK